MTWYRCRECNQAWRQQSTADQQYCFCRPLPLAVADAIDVTDVIATERVPADEHAKN